MLPSARAATFTWINFGSARFDDSAIWFPGAVPDVNDFVSLQVGSGNPYTVTFPGPPLVINGGGREAPVAG
jgi:hypothetical protein